MYMLRYERFRYNFCKDTYTFWLCNRGGFLIHDKFDKSHDFALNHGISKDERA